MNKFLVRQPPRKFKQSGVAAIEFALVASVFFTIVFGILEFARIIYMMNTLADVTRSAAKAAANIDWRNTSEMNLAKQRAIFRNAPGMLPFGDPVTDQHIRIDYMYLKQQGGTTTMEPIEAGGMPTCPGRNRHNCLANPYGGGAGSSDTCVRLVRARICQPGGSECTGVSYQMMIPLLSLSFLLPKSTTIVSAETLGYHPGDTVCP